MEENWEYLLRISSSHATNAGRTNTEFRRFRSFGEATRALLEIDFQNFQTPSGQLASQFYIQKIDIFDMAAEAMLVCISKIKLQDRHFSGYKAGVYLHYVPSTIEAMAEKLGVNLSGFRQYDPSLSTLQLGDVSNRKGQHFHLDPMVEGLKKQLELRTGYKEPYYFCSRLDYGKEHITEMYAHRTLSSAFEHLIKSSDLSDSKLALAVSYPHTATDLSIVNSAQRPMLYVENVPSDHNNSYLPKERGIYLYVAMGIPAFQEQTGIDLSPLPYYPTKEKFLLIGAIDQKAREVIYMPEYLAFQNSIRTQGPSKDNQFRLEFYYVQINTEGKHALQFQKHSHLMNLRSAVQSLMEIDHRLFDDFDPHNISQGRCLRSVSINTKETDASVASKFAKYHRDGSPKGIFILLNSESLTAESLKTIAPFLKGYPSRNLEFLLRNFMKEGTKRTERKQGYANRLILPLAGRSRSI